VFKEVWTLIPTPQHSPAFNTSRRWLCPVPSGRLHAKNRLDGKLSAPLGMLGNWWVRSPTTPDATSISKVHIPSPQYTPSSFHFIRDFFFFPARVDPAFSLTIDISLSLAQNHRFANWFCTHTVAVFLSERSRLWMVVIVLPLHSRWPRRRARG
jgi:hypothetical protein